MNTMQMNTTQSPTQPDYVSASLLAKQTAETSAVRPTNVKNEQPAAKSWSRLPLTFARHLVVLLIGIAATLAWQTYGDSARHMIATALFSADQQQFNATSPDLDEMRQSIGGLAARIASNQEQIMRSIAANQEQTMRSIAVGQERITRSVDQLTAGQEQMTREIAKLQAVDQFVLYKSADPPPGQAPAPVPKPAPRPSQKPTVLTPVKNP